MKKILPNKSGEWTYVFCSGDKIGLFTFNDNGTYSHHENNVLLRTGKYEVVSNDELTLTQDGNAVGWNWKEVYEMTPLLDNSFDIALVERINLIDNTIEKRSNCFYKLTKKN